MFQTLITHFVTLEDPRCQGKVAHKLVDILVIAVCAVIAEASTFDDIALYGRCKQKWLKGFLDLPHGIPSHDTFRRVLMLIDPDAFERCFLAWVHEVFRTETTVVAEQIAIDGKTVRRSFDRRRGRSPLHLVSAYATERGVVLAQRATPDKRGELTVLPEILDGLALGGALVSLDALACRREIAEAIVCRGGAYLITLKANQGKAYDEVRGWFAQHAFARGAALRPCFDAFDDGHGRLVRRRVFACPDVGVFATLTNWPGLTAVLASETIRSVNGTGKTTAEFRYYVSSAPMPPDLLAAAIRRHWAIENGLSWVLDVTFGEDDSRVRERSAARNLAMLRRIALDLVRTNTSLKASLKGKRKCAAWDDSFMTQLITARSLSCVSPGWTPPTCSRPGASSCAP